MRFLFCVAAMLLFFFAGNVRGDDIDSRARKALGLPCPLAEKAAHVLLLPCDCSDTGKCTCDPAKCGCCKGGVQPYAEAFAKVKEEGTVLVAYLGAPGHCVDGAICGTDKPDAAGPRIAVGTLRSGNLVEVKSLPIAATREQVAAAVREAGRKGHYEIRQSCGVDAFGRRACVQSRVWVPD